MGAERRMERPLQMAEGGCAFGSGRDSTSAEREREMSMRTRWMRICEHFKREEFGSCVQMSRGQGQGHGAARAWMVVDPARGSRAALVDAVAVCVARERRWAHELFV